MPGTTWKYVSVVGLCVAKGDRKRPLKGRGDRGEGEKGVAELDGKIWKEGGVCGGGGEGSRILITY